MMVSSFKPLLTIINHYSTHHLPLGFPHEFDQVVLHGGLHVLVLGGANLEPPTRLGQKVGLGSWDS